MSVSLIATLSAASAAVYLGRRGKRKRLEATAYRESHRDRYGVPLRFRRNEAEQAELRNLEEQWRTPPSTINN